MTHRKLRKNHSTNTCQIMMMQNLTSESRNTPNLFFTSHPQSIYPLLTQYYCMTDEPITRYVCAEGRSFLLSEDTPIAVVPSGKYPECLGCPKVPGRDNRMLMSLSMCFLRAIVDEEQDQPQ